MTDANRLYEVWVYLQAEPLFWLTLTVGTILWPMRCTGHPTCSLLNPVAISVTSSADV